MEDKDLVEYNGVKMVKEHVQAIENAQKVATYKINGEDYNRIKFGDEEEDWGADRPCGDCAVLKGQYHVIGCDVERCPRCKGQSIGCDCDYEGDEEDK